MTVIPVTVYSIQKTSLSACLSWCPRRSERFGSVLPYMGREGEWHNQQHTGSRAAPSSGRGVLSIPDNSDAILTAIKPALLLKYNFELRF